MGERRHPRAEAMEDLQVRDRCHAKLDDLFDLYEHGAPLALYTEAGWTTPFLAHRLVITIREEEP